MCEVWVLLVGHVSKELVEVMRRTRVVCTGMAVTLDDRLVMGMELLLGWISTV